MMNSNQIASPLAIALRELADIIDNPDAPLDKLREMIIAIDYDDDSRAIAPAFLAFIDELIDL